jgi:glycine oxidase
MRIGIAGSGLIGRLLAFELHSRGYQITLFDSDTIAGANSAALAAAGMLAPTAELIDADPIIFELGTQSIVLWQTILPKLDPQIYFRQLGAISVAHPSDRAEMLSFKNKLAAAHMNVGKQFQILDQQQLTALEPDLQQFTEGLFLPLEGQLDNQHLMTTLAHYILQHKITWHENAIVQDVKPNKIILTNETYSFDYVIDSRGVGGKSNFPDLRAVRGELIWLRSTDIQFSRPINLLHPRYHLYLVPRPDHQFIIGATMIEAEDYSPISIRSCLELLTAVTSLHRGFAEARIIKTVSQCRPTLASNLPKICYKKGMIAVNGLFRHGYLIAPVIVNEIIDLITQKNVAVKFPSIVEELAA